MLITELNDDELIIIFSYFTDIDLKNVSKVCALFERIIEENFYEKRTRNLLMVSHKKKYPHINERTLNGDMKFSERLRIYQNWIFSACRHIVFSQHRENYEILLEMDSDRLYTASLGELNIYKRRIKDGIDTEPEFTCGVKSDPKIASMKRKGNVLAGCRSAGTIFTFDDENEFNEEFVRDHSCDQLLDLDFNDDIFVTVSRSETSFHQLSDELGMQTFDYRNSMDVGFNTINFDPNGCKLLGSKNDSLHIVDHEKSMIVKSFLNRSQIFHTKWISGNTFLFTSYSSPLALIDTRMDFKRQEFRCGNFTATSMDYDGKYGK
jgi:hypothetical protein